MRIKEQQSGRKRLPSHLNRCGSSHIYWRSAPAWRPLASRSMTSFDCPCSAACRLPPDLAQPLASRLGRRSAPAERSPSKGRSALCAGAVAPRGHGTKGKLRSARERAACAGSMLLWKYRWSDVRGCMRAGERQAIERCVCEVWYVYAGWPVGAHHRGPGAGLFEAASAPQLRLVPALLGRPD